MHNKVTLMHRSGDLRQNGNTIQIQIWCSLIADLILKIIKKGAAVKWSFSNLAAMVRLHLMTYIDLGGFLLSPEKSLINAIDQSIKTTQSQSTAINYIGPANTKCVLYILEM